MPTREEDIEDMEQKLAIALGCKVEHSNLPRALARLKMGRQKLPYYIESFRLIGHSMADTAFAWKFPQIQPERNKPAEVIWRLKSGKLVSPPEAFEDWVSEKYADEIHLGTVSIIPQRDAL